MPISFPCGRFLQVCLAFVCSAFVFPAVGQAQIEDEVAKQIVAAGGYVRTNADGDATTISLRPRTATDFNNIDFSVFQNLRMISVADDQVTDKLLIQLQAIPPGLKILDIIAAPVTDVGLAPLLRKQKALNLVVLSGTLTSDKSLAELAKLKDLHTLYLDETKITDKGLKNLANLQLTHLNLRATRISDGGLLELKGMANLRALFLENTMVTDVGIQNLAGLRDLRLLGVESTKVTENGKITLNALLPNMKFHKLPTLPK
jgi:internalin A